MCWWVEGSEASVGMMEAVGFGAMPITEGIEAILVASSVVA